MDYFAVSFWTLYLTVGIFLFYLIYIDDLQNCRTVLVLPYLRLYFAVLFNSLTKYNSLVMITYCIAGFSCLYLFHIWPNQTINFKYVFIFQRFAGGVSIKSARSQHAHTVYQLVSCVALFSSRIFIAFHYGLAHILRSVAN